MPSFRAPCRICGRPSAVRLDETVAPHNASGRPCSGSNRPPQGELPCSVYCHEVGRVSWPEDLQNTKGAMASTYVCGDPQHQDEAARWVEEITGHRGVFVAFSRRQVAVNG